MVEAAHQFYFAYASVIPQGSNKEIRIKMGNTSHDCQKDLRSAYQVLWAKIAG